MCSCAQMIGAQQGAECRGAGRRVQVGQGVQLRPHTQGRVGDEWVLAEDGKRIPESNDVGAETIGYGLSLAEPRICLSYA